MQSLTGCDKVLCEHNGLLVVENLMKNNRMTLQDIANLAGLNKMTVSRYLRDPNQVSQRSRELISKIMEENNYIPNRAPEILLNARSKTIGVLIPSFRNQIFADVLAGIESVTSACQYQTLIANYEYDAEREEREVLNLLSYNIDGLILTGKLHTERMIQYVRASGVPVAELMDISGQYLDIQVGFDNEKAAFEMTQAFIDSGKRSIAFFGSMDDPRDLSRFIGTEKALSAHGLEAYHLAPKTISSVALDARCSSRRWGKSRILTLFSVPTMTWRLARCWSVRHSSTMCREKWRLPVSTGWKLAVRGCKKSPV